jgi:hypothetical protein
MAKFDSQYPVQLAPEGGDKILIAAAQDGSIMALPFSAVMAYIQKYLNEIDDELSATSLHPVQNRVITKAINDILAQLQPADDKEIISVLTYSDEAPESATAGDLYIDSENDQLKEYQDGQWEDAEAQANVIYITNDTTHFYIYKDGEFVDMTGEPIDNTIYVNSLDELDDYVEAGIYRVCVTTVSAASRSYRWYTFTIERTVSTRLLRVTYTQTLSNRSGYQYRSKMNHDAWSAWNEFIFASQADLQEVYDLACAGL